MPIISRKRINPLDVNRNVTIGTALPLNEQNMFQGTENVKDQILNEIADTCYYFDLEKSDLDQLTLSPTS